MERRKLSTGRVALRPPVNYFASGSAKSLSFVSTGCEVLNSVLGGGYVLGRIANLVGDKSSGKTLLTMEAFANFSRQYPKGVLRYAEAEAAFDQGYARALGMPIDKIQFATGIYTVEDFYHDVVKTLEGLKGRPCIYALDSLDALSDKAEQERDIDTASFGGSKPKKMGELFRRLTQKIEASQMLVIIVSQLRDKIGVTFGETKTRSGGRALDFYASQILWLAEVKKLKKTIDKVERVIGDQIRARCKKNKIGLPFRECEFPIIFGYGVDDLTANVEWLLEVNRGAELKKLGLSPDRYKHSITRMRNSGGAGVHELRAKLATMIPEVWAEVETSFLPTARKYAGD